MSSRGYTGGLFEYSFPGNPINANVSDFDAPAGALVIDTVDFGLFQKTSPRGDNTGFQLISNAMFGSSQNYITPAAPLTGATINMNALSITETIYITPAGTIAALTVVFPTDANSALGQIERLISSQTVTALTLTANGNTILGTAVTAMVANQTYAWQKVAAATWNRI
jgi:hypothetical protein